MIAYRFLCESFTAALERLDLIHIYEVPTSTTVRSLIDVVTQELENSDHHYSFTSSRNPGGIFAASETLALQPLQIANRGLIQQSSGQVHLARTAHSADTTIATLMDDRKHYTIPNIAIEGNCFVLYFGECHYHKVISL